MRNVIVFDDWQKKCCYFSTKFENLRHAVNMAGGHNLFEHAKDFNSLDQAFNVDPHTRYLSVQHILCFRELRFTLYTIWSLDDQSKFITISLPTIISKPSSISSCKRQYATLCSYFIIRNTSRKDIRDKPGIANKRKGNQHFSSVVRFIF